MNSFLERKWPLAILPSSRQTVRFLCFFYFTNHKILCPFVLATSTIADEEDQEEDPYIPTYLNELDPQQDGASYVNDHSSSPTHNDNNNKKKTNKRLPQFHKQGHKQHSADVNGVDGERDLITLSPSSSLTSTAVEQKRELNNNLCEYKDGIAQNNASNFSVETCETSF